MKKVIGIGGVFFKCKDPVAQRAWYKQHLGIESESWGAQFFWKEGLKDDPEGYTAWSPFKQESNYFDPSTSTFMINYRVDNLDNLLAELKKENILPLAKTEESEFGKFNWILDPEGNKIELWEAPK